MTHTIGGTPQGHNVADHAARASKLHGGHRGNSSSAMSEAAKADETSAAGARNQREARAGRMHAHDTADNADVRLENLKAGKQGKDSSGPDAFAATIDGLEKKSAARTTKGKGAPDANDITISNAGAAFAQLALARISDGGRDATASPESEEIAIARGASDPHHSARRLDTMSDRSKMPTDALPEETLTTNIAVNARETHWMFADRKATDAGTAAMRLDRNVLGNSATQDGLASRLHDAMTKASAGENAAGGVIEQGAVANAEPRRHEFDSKRDSGSRSREQTGKGADDRRSAALGAAEKSTRGSLEPSASPTVLPGATQQLKSGILDALTGAERGSVATRATPFQMLEERPSTSGQVIRALDLTLTPPDLGTVKVRLTLQANTLDINAEVSKASTAKLLNDDRTGLEQSLRDSGYDVSSLKIADVSASNAANLNGSANPQNGGEARASFAGRQDADQQRRDGAPSDQSQQRSSGGRSGNGTHEPNTRATSGIYI